MLGDLFERGVDGRGVGDVARDAEQPLGSAGATVGDRNLVAVRGETTSNRETDAAVAAGHENRTRDTAGRFIALRHG